MNRFALTVAVLGLAMGCTEAHPVYVVGSRCEILDRDDGTSYCPEGTYCAPDGLAEGGVPAEDRVCLRICDITAGTLCESGEICTLPVEAELVPWPTHPTCWPGGALEEGASCRYDRLGCARGLICAFEGTTELGWSICEPACDADEDCRAGEACLGRHDCPDGRCGLYGHCGVPCDPREPTSCADGAICQIDRCEWAPRAADCYGADGRADEIVECALGEICSGTSDDFQCFGPVAYHDYAYRP